ncbi:hypothetical protein KNP414_02838 [Paenibacillus mucilaginosus KNP414]|uniref:Uncharacterized protein n=1 Tax=Paenibacillus mucilaginosus (strain KNP414) TaxID=1036673 RepID=F8FCY1_PAEMK|nr:hypothetical protein KNP414_02838 [Paenibacillus mucilaginosus KNP414]
MRRRSFSYGEDWCCAAAGFSSKNKTSFFVKSSYFVGISH